jgi:hypothetical protein
MKTYEQMKYQGKIAVAAACLAVGWLCWTGGSAARAQTPPANLSPSLQEVVKLTQAQMGDDVITAYIKNSGQSYNLSADDILYLHSQGVSQAVISTLLQSKGVASAPPPSSPTSPPPPVSVPVYTPPTPAPTPVYTQPTTAEVYVPPAPPPPGAGIGFDYFHAQLAPFGGWVDLPPYGPVWRPIEAMQPGWRPYFNSGHWEYTDSGWFWQSDYPYGDIVFHYGRWVRDPRLGWCWVPGYDWAPAWVAWRQSDVYAGWAPLPPGAYFEAGVGLRFRGAFGVDLDFGLGYDDFVFVGYDHFWDRDYRPFLAPPALALGVFRASLVINSYNFVDGRFVVEGLGRDRIALLTHHDIRPVAITIRDARIMQAREIQRTVIINRVQEIQKLPASNPLRKAVEERDAFQRSGGVAPRPGGAGPRPGEIAPRPGEVTPRPGEVTPRPGEVTPRPGEVTPRPGDAAPGRSAAPGTRTPDTGTRGAASPYGTSTTPAPGTRTPDTGTRGGTSGAGTGSTKDPKDTTPGR